MENPVITNRIEEQDITKKLMGYSVSLDDKDNVVTAIREVPKGTYSFIISGEKKKIYICKKIRAGFKISIFDIKKRGIIYKYGGKIGIAKSDIRAGNKVHIENMSSLYKIKWAK